MKKTNEWSEFQNAIWFRKKSGFSNFVFWVLNAGLEAESPSTQHPEYRGLARLEILKARVKRLAEQLDEFVSNPPSQNDFAQAYSVIDQAAKTQTELLKGEVEKHYEDPPPPPKDEITWCDFKDGEKQDLGSGLRGAVLNTRYITGFVAGLYVFTGDTAGGLRMFSLAKARPRRDAEVQSRLDKDMNVNDGFATELYLAGHDTDEIVPLLQTALQTAHTHRSVVEDFKKNTKDGPDNKKTNDDIVDKLQHRYDRAEAIFKVLLAYIWAKDALRPQEEMWPVEDVHLTDALGYAKDVYDKLDNSQVKRRDRQDERAEPLLFYCEDENARIGIMDTYAYVVLANQAHNLQVHRIPPDLAAIREARAILENARAEVAQIGKRSDENGLPCLSETRAKGWGKRLSLHLKLVETMLR